MDVTQNRGVTVACKTGKRKGREEEDEVHETQPGWVRTGFRQRRGQCDHCFVVQCFGRTLEPMLNSRKAYWLTVVPVNPR